MVAPYMKTTLNLDDRLLERARKLAAREGVTLTALFEEALRARVTRPAPAAQRFKLELPVVRGERPPRVDVADRDALFDALDEPA